MMNFTRYFIGFMGLLVNSNFVCAALEDCRNEIKVSLGDDVTMNFCEIPAANYWWPRVWPRYP